VWRQAVAAAAPPGHTGGESAGGEDAADGPDHPVHFGNHEHYHVHEDGSGITGLDSNGGHSHLHGHGTNDSGGSHWDAVHDGHEHDDSDLVTAPPSENPYATKRGSMARRYVRPGTPPRESYEDRLVGAWGSIAPGQVTAKDRRAYAVARAESAMAGQPTTLGHPWSAMSALYDRKAPGAAAAGTYRHLGEQVQALYRAASGTGPRIKAAAMSERIPAEGGALVPEELRSEIMINVLEESIIRPRATVIPMREPSSRVPVIEEGSNVSGSVFGGLNFSWVEEQAALSASVASYGLDALRAKKLISYMVVSNELFSDADKLNTFLTKTIPAGLAFAEDAAFIAGSGTLGGTTLGASQPLGIINAGSAINVTRQTSSTVTLQDVYSMVTRLLPKSLNNVIWLASPDVVTKILSMFFNFGSATSGIVPPSGWLTWSPDGQLQLLGRPFYPTEHASAMGTQGDLIAVDPSLYIIGDYQELTIEIATEGIDFINDQSQIRIKARLDGRPALASAVTPANSSQTVSPIIVLK